MEFSSAREHDNGDFSIAEDGEFVGLFEEAVASFGVSDLPVCGVFDSLDLDLPTSHYFVVVVVVVKGREKGNGGGGGLKFEARKGEMN